VKKLLQTRTKILLAKRRRKRRKKLRRQPQLRRMSGKVN
jgi:hypothetical protein